jgi:hypothetical protein
MKTQRLGDVVTTTMSIDEARGIARILAHGSADLYVNEHAVGEFWEAAGRDADTLATQLTEIVVKEPGE